MYQIDFNRPVHVHFIGIGGISMSGLAEILMDRGFTVSGSDVKESSLTDALIKKGARIAFAQVPENITDDIDLVVYTAAVHEDNPELAAVLARGIPTLTRAQLLGQIMKNYELPVAIAGTHGKTTTTSMVSEILMEAGTDPTLTIGGILPSIGGNIRVGQSKYFVAEACEYTNSFLSFFPKVSMILNIDADHLDFFKDLADIRNSFHRFALLLPADGTLIINADIPDLADFTKDLACRVITYSNHTDADYTADAISYDEFAHPTFTAVCEGRRRTLTLGVPGEHNISNALAALAFADLCSIPFEAVSTALKNFTGTDRRFQKKGVVNGVTIIDDYAHHPTEIEATLKAAKNYPHKKLWLVFQPHTYTRTKALLPEFAKALSLADHVILADIYAAREKNTIGISSADLQREVQKTGVPCEYFSDFKEIEKFLQKNYAPSDVVITMGAGNIVDVGEDLLKN